MNDTARNLLLVSLTALSSCAAATLPDAPAEWTSVEPACGYSFRAPSDTVGGEVMGTDSCVTQHDILSCRLTGDAGGFSDPLVSYETEAEYMEDETVIDGRSARWITYRAIDAAYVAAVHFGEFDGEGSKLTLYARCTSSEDRDEMLALFGTVRAAP